MTEKENDFEELKAKRLMWKEIPVIPKDGHKSSWRPRLRKSYSQGVSA